MHSRTRAALFASLGCALALKAAACVSTSNPPAIEGADGAPSGDAAPTQDSAAAADVSAPTDAPSGVDGGGALDAQGTDASDAGSPLTGFDAACPPSGIDAGGQCLVELATGYAGVTGIAVDDAYVYFGAYGDAGGAVMKVPIGGGPASAIAPGQAVPEGVAIDANNVYWVNLPLDAGAFTATVTLNQVGKSGGPITQLASDGMSSTIGSPWAVASDGTNVYFTTGVIIDSNGVQQLGSGTVQQVPVGGGTATTIAQNLSGPYAVAEDSTSVYWSTFAYGESNTGQILKAPKGGFTDGGTPQALVYGVTAPGPLVVDDGQVFFSTLSTPTRIYAVPVVGDVSQVGTSLYPLNGNLYAWGVAADSANVYFSSQYFPGGSGSPYPEPGVGGVVEVIAQDGGVPEGWPEAGPPDYLAQATPGGYGPLGPVYVAVDAYNVYWADSYGSIWRISKPGGPF
jgi:hypothetical protein